jgi:hypothetical protein
MFWTHIYDLIVKVVTLGLCLLLAFNIPILEGSPVLIIALAVIAFFAVYTLWMRTLATYLYCWMTLKMDIDFGQAKMLNPAFTPTLPQEWLPMEHLKDEPKEDRFTMALAASREWEEANKSDWTRKMEDFSNLSNRTKVLKVVMYLLIAYFFVASIANWPPASYVTWAYCTLFNTDTYYPFLTILILLFPTILIFKQLDKDIV